MGGWLAGLILGGLTTAMTQEALNEIEPTEPVGQRPYEMGKSSGATPSDPDVR